MPRPRRYATATVRSRATGSKPAIVPAPDKGVSPVPHGEPTPLTVAEKLQLLKDLDLPPTPGSNFVTLTPQHPFVNDRGALVFTSMWIVECGQSFARWSGLEDIDEPGYVNIWLRLETGRKYIVDVTMEEGGVPKNQQLALTMVLPDDQVLHAAQAVSWQHLVALTEAMSAGWYRYQVFGKNSWSFASCEVTNL